MIQIATNGEILLDRQPTGLRMSQNKENTVIYTPEIGAQRYKVHAMPHARYSAASVSPACGQGIEALERDIRALLGR